MPRPSPPQHPAEVFEHAVVGMALVGLDGRCREVNRALRDMLGRSPANIGEILAGAAGEQVLGEYAFPHELPYRHPDGQPRWGRSPPR